MGDNPQAGLDEPAVDIFKALFGAANEENAVASSIFSDSNPFRRKLKEQLCENDNDGNPEIFSLDKRNKRKRDNDNTLNLSSFSVEEKKSGRGRGQKREVEDDKNKWDSGVKLDVGLVENDSKNSIKNANETDNSNSNFRGKGETRRVGEHAKRKKRKGDEIESKYEIKMYGFETDKENDDACAVGGKRKKENEEDTLCMKEDKVFDAESKVAKTIFVGNLPLRVKKKAIMREFKQFGQIDSVRLRSVPITDLKVPRKVAIMNKKFNENADSVHAYVVYKTEESAHSALSHNMALFCGHHIRVDRAAPPSNKTKSEKPSHYDSKRTVFIGNLPMDVKDEEIYQLFLNIKSLESNVEAVRVVRDSEMGLGKGVAFVLFKTREAAGSVIRMSLKIRNRELRLFRPSQNASHTNATRPSSAPAARTTFQATKGSWFPKECQPKMKMQHSGKRPSVAARKERMKAQKNRDLRRQLQDAKKRKFDNRTSGSYRGEKAKKQPKKAARL